MFDTIDPEMLAQKWTLQMLGPIAEQTLNCARIGSILGLTARGTFLGLKLPAGLEVVFVTSQPCHGPLTCNLSGVSSPWPPTGLTAGAEFQVTPTEIRFSNPPVIVSRSTASVWTPPARMERILPPHSRQVLLDEVIIGLAPSGKTSAALLAGPQTGSSAMGQANQFYTQLLSGLIARSPLLALKPALHFLGWGSGLTPSGDDLLCGLMLALHRYGHALLPGFDAAALSGPISRAAAAKTTSLSAGLIRAASQGLADERQLVALDGLLTGTPGAGQIIQSLIDFGASSGADTLAGYSLAIHAAAATSPSQ